jgi:hypothetical protein
MPIQRLTKLEDLTKQLEDIIVIMQQVADFRQQKAEKEFNQIKHIIEALEQQDSNLIVANKELNAALGNIHVKLHQISNQMMALVNNMEEIAEYASLLEANQELMKKQLNIKDDTPQY